MLPLLLTDISRARVPLNPGTRVLRFCWTSEHHVVAFLKLNIWLPPWILLLVQSFPCLLCPIILPCTSFFLLLRSWRGKLLSVSRILRFQHLLCWICQCWRWSCCLSWISIEIWELLLATVSEALGVGPCVSWTLPWNLYEWWTNEDFGIHPCRLLSLQEQSGFTGCSYRARAIFICPDFLLFLPVLSKFPCRNGAIGFPKISSCRSRVGWQLSFQDFCFSRCCKSHPWLVGTCQMFRPKPRASSWAVKHPALESHPWDPGAGLLALAFSWAAWGRLQEEPKELRAFLLWKVHNCSAKFVISAGNVWTKVFILSCIDPVIFQPQSFQLERPGRENFSGQTPLPNVKVKTHLFVPKYFLSLHPSAGVEEGNSCWTMLAQRMHKQQQDSEFPRLDFPLHSYKVTSYFLFLFAPISPSFFISAVFWIPWCPHTSLLFLYCERGV